IGVHDVRVMACGSAEPLWSGSVDVTGDTVVPIEVSALTGHVTAQLQVAGQPLPQSFMTLFNENGERCVTTASSGKWTRLLAPGSYTLYAAGATLSDPAAGPFTFTVAAGEVTDFGTIDLEALPAVVDSVVGCEQAPEEDEDPEPEACVPQTEVCNGIDD